MLFKNNHFLDDIHNEGNDIETSFPSPFLRHTSGKYYVLIVLNHFE
jgi:hypothetical protein